MGLLTCDASQVKQEVFTLMAIDQEFEIPPGVENYSVPSQHAMASRWCRTIGHHAAHALSWQIVSPIRCRGESEMLLHVPNYDFNWQHTYQLQQPLPLDALRVGFAV
ncbi:MAG: hypothetical protein R3C56_28215 [Pirellulaceae bacterium]